jgi:hypothetical protein
MVVAADVYTFASLTAGRATAAASKMAPPLTSNPPLFNPNAEDDRALLRRQRAALRLLGELQAARVVTDAAPLIGVVRELVGDGAVVGLVIAVQPIWVVGHDWVA